MSQNELDTKDVHAILLTLVEESLKTAAMYSKSAGRTDVSSMDMKYALQYQAHEYMNTPGLAEKVDENYEHASDSEEDSESEDSESESDHETFTRSESDDPLIVKMNRYHDDWDSWIPDTPIETAMKRAVDRAEI